MGFYPVNTFLNRKEKSAVWKVVETDFASTTGVFLGFLLILWYDFRYMTRTS